MKKILYSAFAGILLSALLFVGGCKKTASVNGHVAQVQTGSAITTYQYDNQGRLTSFTDANGTVALTYSTSSVSVTYNGATTVYTLNNQGYASTDGTDEFAYDNNGYLLSITTPNNGTINYSMNNGDLSTIISGNTTQDAFTYLTTTDYRDYGLYFLGKAGSYTNLNPKSHNLVNTDIEGANTYQYTYTYDGQGRVQTQTVTGAGATTTSVFTYTTN